MKLIEPILFPIAPDPLVVMKFAGMNNLKEIDVLPNISPYYKHYDLYYKYVDPALLQQAVIDLFDENTPKEYLGMDSFISYWFDKLIEINSPYNDYYRLFITKFLLIHSDYEQSCSTLKLWLETIGNIWNFTFKKCFSLNKLVSLKRKYNTIIIPELWTKEQRNIIPWINLLHDLHPRFFSQEGVIKEASEYLFEGGSIYTFRPQDFWKVMYSVGDGYDIKDAVLTKKTSPKTKTQINNINWL